MSMQKRARQDIPADEVLQTLALVEQKSAPPAIISSNESSEWMKPGVITPSGAGIPHPTLSVEFDSKKRSSPSKDDEVIELGECATVRRFRFQGLGFEISKKRFIIDKDMQLGIEAGRHAERLDNLSFRMPGENGSSVFILVIAEKSEDENSKIVSQADRPRYSDEPLSTRTVVGRS